MIFFIIFLPIFLKNSMAAEDVQDITKIVAELEDFKNDVISLTEQANDIKASLPKLTLEISEAIQMDPLVTLQKEKLDIAKNNGDLVDECENILLTKYKWVVDEIYEFVSNKISARLEIIQNDLQSIQEKTMKLIDKLQSKDLSPSVIKEIIDTSDEDFHVVGRLKHTLQTLVRNALYDLDEEPTANLVKDNLLKPVYECLENSKITEHKGM